VETFLTGSIPNLQLDSLSSQFYRFNLKIDADRGDEGVIKGIIAESEQNASLPDTRVAD
jgi:hypothetical protein